MAWKRIPLDDLFGIFFVRKPDGMRLDSYYKTLDALRPLFKNEEIQEVIDGFYLNICGNFDSVRISYFVNQKHSEKAISLFRKFFRNNGILEIENSKHPRKKIVAESYGGEEYEERFRTFLVLETQIGLELMEGNLLHARILLATYRWQIRKASLPLRKHFESTFRKYSPTFNAFSNEEKEQFFADLGEWPNPPQVDWGHLMVNLVLPGDWLQVFSDPHYLTPGRPLSIPQINRKVKELGFQIPLNWKP